MSNSERAEIATVRHEAIVIQAKNFMLAHLQDNISLEEIANHVGLSVYSMMRSFKYMKEPTPAKLLWQYRAQTAIDLLVANDAKIVDMIKEAGFNSQSHFSRYIRQNFGKTPTQYIAQMRSEKDGISL